MDYRYDFVFQNIYYFGTAIKFQYSISKHRLYIIYVLVGLAEKFKNNEISSQKGAYISTADIFLPIGTRRRILTSIYSRYHLEVFNYVIIPELL